MDVDSEGTRRRARAMVKGTRWNFMTVGDVGWKVYLAGLAVNLAHGIAFAAVGRENAIAFPGGSGEIDAGRRAGIRESRITCKAKFRGAKTFIKVTGA